MFVPSKTEHYNLSKLLAAKLNAKIQYGGRAGLQLSVDLAKLDMAEFLDRGYIAYAGLVFSYKSVKGESDVLICLHATEQCSAKIDFKNVCKRLNGVSYTVLKDSLGVLFIKISNKLEDIGVKLADTQEQLSSFDHIRSMIMASGNTLCYKDEKITFNDMYI